MMTMDPKTTRTGSPSGSLPQALDEDRVLIACALRLDGWKYIERMGFDHVGAGEAFIATGAACAPPRLTAAQATLP